MHPLKLRYLKLKARERRETIWLSFNERSLTKINPDYEKRVREELSQRCEKINRKLPLRGNVGIQFHVAAGSKKIGPLENILKKHIDLLYPPKVKNPYADFSKLKTLLHDDAQVEYISANLSYFGRNESSSWDMEVVPISLISEWCKLIKDVRNEYNFDTSILSQIREELTEKLEENKFHHFDDDDLIKYFFKMETANTHPELIEGYRVLAQHHLLKRHQLTFDLWSQLFQLKRFTKSQSDGLFGKLQEIIKFGEMNLKRSTENILELMSIGGFSEVPSPEQKSKVFFRNLQDKINKSPFKNEKLKKWEWPISVSCFYRPPGRNNSFEADLDNITRHILREIKQCLKPPTIESKIEKNVDFGINFFECKRIGRMTQPSYGEICFFLQPLDTTIHFWNKLDDAKNILKRLNELKDERHGY